MAKDTKHFNNKDTKSNNSGAQYFGMDDKAIFDEVDEELRNEKFKQLVNKHGGVVLALVVLALAITVGYEKIAQWKIHKAETKNIQYTQALSSSANYENNIVEFENIVHTETGAYRDYAQLQIANILLENNQLEKGFSVLEKIYHDESISEGIREIAAIKLATYKVDQASFDEIKALLEPIANKNGAWSPMAKELLAMSAVHNKNFELAKEIYNELSTSDISDGFKARIDDMLAVINDAN